MASSSLTRWAQVCFARMVFNPCSACAFACLRGCPAGKRNVCLHLLPIVGDKIICAGCEQAFRVVPGRADERNAAGQGFKHTDGRNTRQRTHIGAARHMDGQAVAGEHCRARTHWAASRRTRYPQMLMRFQRVFGITHAVHLRAFNPSALTGSIKNSCSSAVRSSSPQLPIQTRSPSQAEEGRGGEGEKRRRGFGYVLIYPIYSKQLVPGDPVSLSPLLLFSSSPPPASA